MKKIMLFNMNWNGLLKFDGSVYAVVCPSCSKKTGNMLTQIDLEKLDPTKQSILKAIRKVHQLQKLLMVRNLKMKVSCLKETDNILIPIDTSKLDPIKQCIMCDISVRDFNQNERN